MKEATIDDFLNFFRNLDFKSKIEVINQFTLELKKGVDRIAEDQEKSGEDQVIDELFGHGPGWFSGQRGQCHVEGHRGGIYFEGLPDKGGHR